MAGIKIECWWWHSMGLDWPNLKTEVSPSNYLFNASSGSTILVTNINTTCSEAPGCYCQLIIDYIDYIVVHLTMVMETQRYGAISPWSLVGFMAKWESGCYNAKCINLLTKVGKWFYLNVGEGGAEPWRWSQARNQPGIVTFAQAVQVHPLLNSINSYLAPI